MSEKIQIVCDYCGSSDVTRDACARFDTDAQDWVASAIYDDGNCEVCGGEARLEEVPLDEWEHGRQETEVVANKEVGVVFYDDEKKWRGQVSDEDVGPIWSSRLLYDTPDEAKDAARKWAIREEED